MSKLQKSILLATTALSLAAPAAVRAADSVVAAGQAEIEQIVVTARRREERLQDVPISISVFSQQQLSNHNVVNAQDLAAYTPSLSANTNFGAQNTSFAIRGFTEDIGTAPTVGVFFADVVAPRGPTQGTQAGDGAGPGEFFDLQNVQVLKGPQGTLFGLNTTGGDVLLVPQKPTDAFGGYVEGTFGNFNERGGQGVINIPVDDQIRLRLGIDHESRDGYVHNTSGIGPSDFNDTDFTALRASLDVDVTSDLENYTIATYSQSETNGDLQKMIGCDPNGPFEGLGLHPCGQLTPGAPNFQGSGFYDGASDQPNSFSDVTDWRVINATTWHVSDELTVKNIASYAQLEDRLQSPLFGTNMYTQATSSLPSYRITLFDETLPPGGANTDQATYTEEFQLQGNNFDNRLTWQGGLYLEGSDPLAAGGYNSPGFISCANPDAYQCYDVLGQKIDGHLGDLNYTSGSTFYADYAAYGQATYKLTDEFKFTGGIRYTEDRETNTSTQITDRFSYPPPYGPIVPTVTSSCSFPGATPDISLTSGCEHHFVMHSHAPTWLLDVDYTPTDDILAYAKYARGYREGVIVQNIVAPLNLVRPEKVDDYEAGMKTSFDSWGVKGTFDVDGFYEDFNNMQLLVGFEGNPCQTAVVGGPCVANNVESETPTSAPFNGGTSHIFGAELDSAIIPYEGLTLEVHYTYLDAMLITAREPTLPTTSIYQAVGLTRVGRLPSTPRNKVSLSASYQLPVDESIGKITVGTTFTHTDAYSSSFTQEADQSVSDPNLRVFSRLPATNLLDLSVNWDQIAGKPVDLSFYATNVTGDKYYTWIPGITGYGFETAEIGAPCFYGVRLKIHFGED